MTALQEQEQFDRLIQKLEIAAAKSPTAYQVRVGLLALLGYAYIGLVLLVLSLLLLGVAAVVLQMIKTGHTGGAAGLKLVVVAAFVLIFLGYTIVRSLWVTIPEPQGLKLTQQDAPALFQVIRELQLALKTPPIHRVLVTSEFNAALSQRPRLGILGWQQNYLILGLPLMQVLAPNEFRSVLAHELGHLSGNHSRFAAWIYRIRQTYTQIMKRLAITSQSSGSWEIDLALNCGSQVLGRFFDWYSPFFAAYSFVLARLNEYEADRCAAQLTSPQAAASALVRIHVKGQYLNQSFWSDLYQKASQEAEPPAAVTALIQMLQQPVNADIAQNYLQRSLAETTSNADTHPCLRDRLMALGYHDQAAALLELESTSSAAQQFLGNALPHLLQHLDQEWQAMMNFQWRERYRQCQDLQQQIDQLTEKAKQSPLSLDDSWLLAFHTIQLSGISAAVPLLRQILGQQPDHSAANYFWGQFLLSEQDEAGITFLEKAMEEDFQTVLSGCELIYTFLMQQGRESEAQKYLSRARQHDELLTQAAQERKTLHANSSLQAHQLSHAAVEALQRQLDRFVEIQLAYLAQKQVKFFPEAKLYILGVKLKRIWWNSAQKQQELMVRLCEQGVYPEQTIIYMLDTNTAWLENKLKQQPGALIYQRR